MDTPQGPAAPASGTSEPEIPTYEELLADPEIAALLDFEPVPRRTQVEGGWSPEKQRELIARLAVHGSANKACTEMGMHRTGLTKVAHSKGAGSFQEAWEGAVALARRRRTEQVAAEAAMRSARLPTIDHRRKAPVSDEAEWDDSEADEILNEYGEPEDRRAFNSRVDAAQSSIARKLLNVRRLYLQEISASPGKRAAFEILTELPIDWDKAARLEPQDDEPYNIANQRQADMILTAESGWTAGEFGYGRDRRADAQRMIDELRAEMGLPAVRWEEDE